MANKALAVLAVLGGLGAAVILATRGKAEPLPGMATLSGIITDAVSGLELPGVSVVVDGHSGQTNTAGFFELINIQPGDYSVTLSKAGYETVVI